MVNEEKGILRLDNFSKLFYERNVKLRLQRDHLNDTNV